MDNYKCIYEEFLTATNCLDKNLFTDIKLFFKDIINSPRTYDYVNSLKELLRVLEKRGALAFDDIRPLRYIAQIYIKDLKLDEKLAEFEKQFCLDENQPKISLFSPGESKESILIDPLTNIPFSNSNTPKLEQTSERIFTENRIQHLVILNLSEELGNRWRDFARYLNIKEADIDVIHMENPVNFKENSKKVLTKYFIKASLNNWKMPLLDALDKIRRRDLKEYILHLLHTIDM